MKHARTTHRHAVNRCEVSVYLIRLLSLLLLLTTTNLNKGLLVSVVKHKEQTLSFLSLCSYLKFGQLISSLSIYLFNLINLFFVNLFQNWENEIASQMYMLIWLDFFSHIFSSLVVTSIRK